MENILQLNVGEPGGGEGDAEGHTWVPKFVRITPPLEFLKLQQYSLPLGGHIYTFLHI
jgi:hypothetical protein